MYREEIDLKGLKLKKVSGEIPREEYWFEVKEVVSRFKDLFEIQSSNVNSIEIHQGGELILSYKVGQANEIKMFIDPNDLRTAPMSIITEGNYEEYESSLLLQIASVSNLFCDIGANIGFYTLACSATNPNLKILCFEPNKLVVNHLTQNLELNSVTIDTDNITIFPIALGVSKSNEAEFYVPAISGSGAGSLKNLHPEEGKARSFKTDIDYLDAVLVNEGNLDLIKIDVEGFELSVLKGGLESIKQSKPTIFIELLRKWMKPFGNHPQDVIDLLVEYGYFCFAIGIEGLTKINAINDETVENNFIFVHPQRVEHLKIILEG